MIHASTLSGVSKPGPSIAEAQTSPDAANQLNSRCRLTASTTISTNARPIDRHRMERIGGDRICESALTASSSMTAYPLQKTLPEVTIQGGFGKGMGERTDGRSVQRKERSIAEPLNTLDVVFRPAKFQNNCLSSPPMLRPSSLAPVRRGPSSNSSTGPCG